MSVLLELSQSQFNTRLFPGPSLPIYLAECFGLEASELVLLCSKAALDWFAADFAVLDECLAADG
jgi:hypothetical protein